MRDMFFNMNQNNMIKLKARFTNDKGRSEISIEDFILLRRIGDFILSSETVAVIKENEIFHWVNYGTIQESLPIVFPNLKSVKSRIEKLKKLGLLINKAHVVKKSDVSEDSFKTAGKFSVIQLSKEVRQLFDEPIKTKANDSKPAEGGKGKPAEGGEGKPARGGYPKPARGGYKEPQEKNPKKRNPSLGCEASLSEKDKKEIYNELKENTMKLQPVSKAISKYDHSTVFHVKILVPLAEKHGKQAIINVLKDIKTDNNSNVIKDLEGLIKSKL